MTRLAYLAVPLSALVLACSLVAAPSASASAWGCSFGNPAYGPTQYCVYISGSGDYVNSVTGNFSGSATVCAWYITAEFFDLSWHWYQTVNSRTHTGCSTAGGDVIPISSWKYTGYMCSTLHYSVPVFGWRTMSVCQGIRP